MPVASRIFTASTSLSMSASITAMRSLCFRRDMSCINVLVFPLPGEDIRFSRNTPFSFSSALSRSASLSLSSKTLFLISITFMWSIGFMFSVNSTNMAIFQDICKASARVWRESFDISILLLTFALRPKPSNLQKNHQVASESGKTILLVLTQYDCRPGCDAGCAVRPSGLVIYLILQPSGPGFGISGLRP